MAISYPASLPEEKFNEFLEHVPDELRESGKYDVGDLRLAFLEGFEEALSLLVEKGIDVEL
jgi:hypothetical protein